MLFKANIEVVLIYVDTIIMNHYIILITCLFGETSLELFEHPSLQKIHVQTRLMDKSSETFFFVHVGSLRYFSSHIILYPPEVC